MEQNLNNNRTTDKIPHSFHLGEQPVQEFDNTSLEEAVEKGYIATPDHVHDLVVTERLPVEAQPAVEKKSKKGLVLGATAGMAGVAIAAGAFIGLNSGDSSEAAPETPPQSPGTEEVVPEVPVDITDSPEAPVEANEPETPAPSVEANESSEKAAMEEILNMPKPERWDELDSLTLEQFNQQPIEDRVNYASWLNRDRENLAKLWYEASGNPRDELVIEMSVNPDNTGEEILADARSLQRGAITRHFEAFDLSEVPLYEDLQREKMISASYLYPSHPAADFWRKTARDGSINGYVPGLYYLEGSFLADEEVTYRSENYTTIDTSGIERTSVDLTYREPTDGSVYNAQLILIETEYTSQWVAGR